MTSTQETKAIVLPAKAEQPSDWMRGLFLGTQAKGWTFTQITTMVDQYRLGDVVVTMLWGATKLLEVSATKGKTQVLHSHGGQAKKLQRAQHQGFKIKEAKAKNLADLEWIWAPSAKVKAEALALTKATIKNMD